MLGSRALHTQLLMLFRLFKCLLLPVESNFVSSVLVAILQVKAAESLPTGNT